MERPSEGSQLKIGEKAPYISLQGTDNHIYTLRDFEGCKALVVVFTCNHCPYSQAYENRLIAVANEFRPLGVKFLAICANDSSRYPEDSFDKMKVKSEALGYPYPYLWDELQITARAYDAACTPEVYVFDSQFLLRYHGSIDDNYIDAEGVKKQYLRDALNALLDNRAVEPELTHVIGCSIKWKP